MTDASPTCGHDARGRVPLSRDDVPCRPGSCRGRSTVGNTASRSDRCRDARRRPELGIRRTKTPDADRRRPSEPASCPATRDVIDPEGKIEYGFRMLSWEIWMPTRLSHPPGPALERVVGGETGRQSAIWSQLPAVRAAQVGTWWCSSAFKQDVMTAHLNELADLLTSARVVG